METGHGLPQFRSFNDFDTSMDAWIDHYRQLPDSQEREVFFNALVQHYTQCFDATGVGFLLLDESMCVLSRNDLVAELLGHAPSIGQYMVKPCDLFEWDDGQTTDDCVIARALNEQRPCQDEVKIRRNGERRWLRLTAIAVKMLDARQVLLMMQDISGEKRLEADLLAKQRQLDKARTRDPLTGLSNRRYILEELDHLNAKARRYGTVFSIALIDLDHFKAVNDTYGHEVADNVLLHLASLIQDELRDADITARYGEEEFMVLLPETQVADAVHTVNRLRQRFTESRVAGINRSLTLSAGVMEWETRFVSGAAGVQDRPASGHGQVRGSQSGLRRY